MDSNLVKGRNKRGSPRIAPDLPVNKSISKPDSRSFPSMPEGRNIDTLERKKQVKFQKTPSP